MAHARVFSSVSHRLAPLALAGALLAGCTQTAWDRADTEPQAMQADYIQCRQSARQEAYWQYAYNRGFPMMGPMYWGYRNRPANYVLWRQSIESDRFFYENRMTSFCMRNKGYSLVEIDKDAPVAPAKLR
jgi:hypothetical protein